MSAKEAGEVGPSETAHPPPPPPSIPPPPGPPPPINPAPHTCPLPSFGNEPTEVPGGDVAKDPDDPSAYSLARAALSLHHKRQRFSRVVCALEFTPSRLGHETTKREEYHAVSLHWPTNPIIQRGPSCGLVALAMVAELLQRQGDVTADFIFKEAQKRGYTKQGEMFSVEEMAKLAKELLQCEAEVMKAGYCPREMAKTLTDSVLLFPYDADKDHHPFNKKGHKAHWSLIVGFCFLEQDGSQTDFQRSVDTESLQTMIDATASKSSVTAYVYGRQGTSKHMGVWHWEAMVTSCLQLEELCSDKNPKHYQIPPGGVSQGLGGKCVCVKIPADKAERQEFSGSFTLNR